MANNDRLNFNLKFNDESSTVEVWCEGREYCACDQAYRPIYAYKITSTHWEYVANDIRGAANEAPNLVSAAQSLFSFLYACQEGMPHPPGRLIRNENYDLFPEHVREWAYNHNDEISMLNLSLEAQNL